MKNKSLLLLSIFLVASLITSAQDKLYFSGGTTFSSVKNYEFKLKDQFGYYVGFGTTSNSGRYFNIVGEVQVMSQRASNDIVSFHSNSLNLSLYYKYHPFDFNLNVLFGIQMGFIMNSSIKAQDTTIRDRDVRFSGVGGLSYELNRFEIIARYNHRFDGSDIFRSPIQAGVHYYLSGKD